MQFISISILNPLKQLFCTLKSIRGLKLFEREKEGNKMENENFEFNFQSESPSRKRRRISRNSTVSGIEVQETTPPVASAPTIHAPTQPWELAAPPQRQSPGIHVRESAVMRSRYRRLSETYAQTCPFLQGVHNPHLPSSHNVHPGLHNNHHNIHNPHHSLHAHPSHAHHPSGSSHHPAHPAQGTSGPVVVEVGQVGVSGLGVAVSGDTLWHPQTAGYRLPCQLHGYYTPAGPHAFAHSCQVRISFLQN